MGLFLAAFALLLPVSNVSFAAVQVLFYYQGAYVTTSLDVRDLLTAFFTRFFFLAGACHLRFFGAWWIHLLRRHVVVLMFLLISAVSLIVVYSLLLT